MQKVKISLWQKLFNTCSNNWVIPNTKMSNLLTCVLCGSSFHLIYLLYSSRLHSILKPFSVYAISDSPTMDRDTGHKQTQNQIKRYSDGHEYETQPCFLVFVQADNNKSTKKNYKATTTNNRKGTTTCATPQCPVFSINNIVFLQ